MSYYLTNENSFLNINNAHLKVSGNVHADVMKIGAVEFAPTASNVTTTTNFTNVTTGLSTSSNLHVGGTLTMGTVEVIATTHNLENTTTNGNVTTHTVEFQNTGTSLVASGNVEVAKELTVTGNVEVAKELTVTGNVEVAKELTVTGNATVSSNLTVSGDANGLTTFGPVAGLGFEDAGVSFCGIKVGEKGTSPYSRTALSVEDSGTTILHVDGNNQRVGVGTTSPDKAKLQVHNSIALVNNAWKTSGDDDQLAGEINFYLGGNVTEQTTPVASIMGYDKYSTSSGGYAGALAFKVHGNEYLRIENGGTLTGSAINGLTRNFSKYDNLGSDGAWRSAFTVGTTAIGLFSVLSYAAGTSQNNALWYYQYKSGGTSGDVIRITGSSSPNFRFVSSSRTIEHNGNGGTHFTQLRVFPFEI